MQVTEYLHRVYALSNTLLGIGKKFTCQMGDLNLLEARRALFFLLQEQILVFCGRNVLRNALIFP